MKYKPQIQEIYRKDIVSTLEKKFLYKTPMQVPRLEKICINQGIGAATNDKKLIEIALTEITNITGQKAVVTRSKKDISNFKLRKGVPIGVRVTLRSIKMYEFLERLIAASLPRIRDFSGISPKGFDGRGNYTLGITEQIIFPEIDIDKVNKITGMDITFVTSAKTDEEAKALLIEFGLPFSDKGKGKKKKTEEKKEINEKNDLEDNEKIVKNDSISEDENIEVSLKDEESSEEEVSSEEINKSEKK